MRIGGESHLVRPVPEQGEPARVVHDNIEHVTVDHQKATTIGGLVDDCVHDLDPTKVGAEVVAQELIMVP